MCGSDVFLAILAVFFPPIAVWIKVGICSADSIINLALCCLGYVPGLLHSWYIILKHPEPDYDDPNYEPLENGRVTYYYVSRQPADQTQGRGGYGATESTQPRPPQAPSAAPQHFQNDGGAGSSDGQIPPPPYTEAIKGDHKVQTHD
ncbi:hypothetical protein Plec18167_008218 [Paecilomyces lecythidis]|uniref:Stress response RCI peptide n=1 Tax=Paecilomyces lecythidis TaxID=3004212 RepID=A0ABR3WYQ6_9EURO